MTLNHSTLWGLVLLFAVGCAETPKSTSTMSDAGTVAGDPSTVQERAVTMQKSGYTNVLRTVGPRTPIRRAVEP